MSEWISVEDRLPDQGVEVIGYNGHAVRECFIMWLEDDLPIWGYEDWRRFGEVTHWMLLPSNPT